MMSIYMHQREVAKRNLGQNPQQGLQQKPKGDLEFQFFTPTPVRPQLLPGRTTPPPTLFPRSPSPRPQSRSESPNLGSDDMGTYRKSFPGTYGTNQVAPPSPPRTPSPEVSYPSSETQLQPAYSPPRTPSEASSPPRTPSPTGSEQDLPPDYTQRIIEQFGVESFGRRTPPPDDGGNTNS